jgi:hypothetical protein
MDSAPSNSGSSSFSSVRGFSVWKNLSFCLGRACGPDVPSYFSMTLRMLWPESMRAVTLAKRGLVDRLATELVVLMALPCTDMAGFDSCRSRRRVQQYRGGRVLFTPPLFTPEICGRRGFFAGERLKPADRGCFCAPLLLRPCSLYRLPCLWLSYRPWAPKTNVQN